MISYKLKQETLKTNVLRYIQLLHVCRFIETYGTHIIVGVSIGGQDVVFLRQDQSSNLPPSQLKKHLDELGDQLFTGTCTLSLTHCKTKEHKSKVHATLAS